MKRYFRTLSLIFLTVLVVQAQQWEQAKGPYGGIILSLTSIGTNLFAGTNGGGVFVSTNNGTLWTSVNTGLTNKMIFSLATSGSTLLAGTNIGVFLSADSGIVWVPTKNILLGNKPVMALGVSGTNIYAGTMGGGVFLSSNNGTTWTAINTGLSVGGGMYVSSILVNGANIFIGTQGGIFLSTNGGTSWTAVNSGLSSSGNVKSLAVNGTNLFATAGGVYRSINNGTSWTLVNSISMVGSTFTALLVNGGNLYASGYGTATFQTANNGTSWTAIGSGLPQERVNTYTAIGTTIFAGTTGGVYLSNNNGISWTPVKTGILNNSVWSLATNGNNIFAGSDFSGVFRSGDNGASWSVANSGLPGIRIYTLAANGSNIFAGTWDNYTSDLYRSTNSGTSWTKTNWTPYTIQSIIVCGANLFAAKPDSGVLLSTNNGISWAKVNNGLTSLKIAALAVSGINLFAGTIDSGVFLSKNNGASWLPVNNGLTESDITSLIVSGINLFAGTKKGKVFTSANNGVLWTEVGTGTDNYSSVNALVASGTHLYAGVGGGFEWGFDGGVYESSFKGSAWSDFAPDSIDFPGTQVNCLSINGQYLLAGTVYTGLFRLKIPASPVPLLPYNGEFIATQTTPLKWLLLPGTTSYRVQVSTISDFSSTIKDTSGCTDTIISLPNLASGSTYFWRVKTDSSDWSPTTYFVTENPSKIRSPSTMPSSIELSTNSTAIKYVLEKPSNVAIRIYSLQGKLLKSICYTYQPSGRYHYALEKLNLSSGSYLLNFKAGLYCLQKRITIL